jgi:hypothetical protein
LKSLDWLHLSPYSSPATFTSRVLDAGSPVAWQGLSWDASTPAGTDLAVSVRTGPTPTPDASWTAFAPVASSGDAVGADARYLQYQAVLSSSDPDRTPMLEDVHAAYAPIAPFLSDGFESGLGSDWTGHHVHVEGTLVDDGALALRATSDATKPSYAANQLASGHQELFARVRVNVQSLGANPVLLLRLRSGASASLLRLILTQKRQLRLRDDVSPKLVTSTKLVSLGAWHTIGLHVIVAGAASSVQVTLDGKTLTNLGVPLDLGFAPAGKLQLGDNSATHAFDVAFDDVVLSDGPIGG